MAVFVILALALAVAALGSVVAAGIAVSREARRLSEVSKRAADEIQRLSGELGEEAAVMSLEVEALQRRAASRRSEQRGGYTTPTSLPVDRR